MNLRRLVADTLAHLTARFLSRVLGQKRYFHLWEERGFHVSHVHFYAPIPDTRTLKDELWVKRSSLAGIDMREAFQLGLLDRFTRRFSDEYDCFPAGPASTPHQYYINNLSFEAVDGEMLYCMIRHFKPQTIIEIGSGFSTCLAAQAIEKTRLEGGHPCELIAIEPYPNQVLKSGFPGLTRLIERQVQDVPLSEFSRLRENDILFIDSSHVLAIGSDVQYEYLEILPSLNRGVIIHVHDIFLPMEYPRDWVLKEHRFWSEQYLLQAFLSFNRDFEVLWAGHYLHVEHPDKLEAAFKSYRREKGPVSFWMRKVN